jgi:thiamine biosynthesis lipoprotein
MQVERVKFASLGSTCHLYGVELSKAELMRGAAWVAQMHQRLTRFDPQSELSRFNAGSGRWVEISHELEALLSDAGRAYHLSEGLVNAAVLPAMGVIGYTRPLQEGPTSATLERAQPAPALPDVLEVAPGRARLAPGTGIDLGGLAKGWLADRLCRRLGGNSLVNLGGDLAARGPGPEGDGWPVGLGSSTVLLVEAAAATSSTQVRRWGDGIHHLIDPRTGRPVESDLSQVSVVARTGFLAEVYAKTALMLGQAGAPAYLATRAMAWSLT